MRALALLAALLVLAAPLLAGCLQSRPDDPGPPTLPPGADDPDDGDGTTPPPDAGAPGNGEELALAIEPAEATLTPGETTTFTIRLTVHRTTTIQHRGCPPELLDLWVEVEGERVDLYTYGEEPMFGACAVREVTLEEGEETREVQWNGHMGRQAPEPHGGDAVAPGTYTLRAKLGAVDREVTAEGTVTVVG